MNCSKQSMIKVHCNIRVLRQDILASSRPTGKEGPYCLRIVDLEGKEVKCFVILERIGNANAEGDRIRQDVNLR